GGQRNGTQTWNDGAFYVQNGWTALSTTGAVPGGRLNHHAVVIDQPPGNLHMVIFGGQQLDPGTGLPSDILGGGVYRQVTFDWLPITAPGGPTSRHWASAVSIGPEMVLWGGAAGDIAQSDGRRYNPISNV